MPVENLPKATKIIEKAKKIPKKKLIESSTIDTRDMTLPSKDIALPKALIHVSEKTKIIQKKTSKSSDISLVSILKSKIRSDLVATKEIKTVV
uniref:Uncharacterized protein n=1 Tax=Acrobeloides nanus TaxID=290746 RepID=A0A914DML9_9BILA